MTDERDAIRFHGLMMRVAHRHFAASVEGGGEDFRNRIYAEYRAAGASQDAEGWLQGAFASLFLWVSKPPRWVEEPAWPFLEGNPMIFISQSALPDNDVVAQRLAARNELYLFGARVPAGAHFSLKFEVVTQWLP